MELSTVCTSLIVQGIYTYFFLYESTKRFPWREHFKLNANQVR